MKSGFISVIAFLALMLYPDRISAQSVTSYALPDTLTSGDTFHYVITSMYQPSDYVVYYPDEDEFSHAFEFRGSQRYKGVLAQDSVVYRLQYFGIRDTLIGDMNVVFVQGKDTLYVRTPPIPIYFKSNLESDEGELKPFKPIFDFPRSWWMMILLGIILVIGAYILWKFRNRLLFRKSDTGNVSVDPIPPYLSPFSVFENALDRLKHIQNYSTDRDLMQWHIELSDAIRTYLEHCHDIDALEMTTREIHHTMIKKKLHPDVTGITLEICKQCDMVKFAKLTVDTHQTLQLLEKAEKLRDLFRFLDSNVLRQLKYQHEMKHGLRPESKIQTTNMLSASKSDSLDDIIKREIS